MNLGCLVHKMGFGKTAILCTVTFVVWIRKNLFCFLTCNYFFINHFFPFWDIFCQFSHFNDFLWPMCELFGDKNDLYLLSYYFSSHKKALQFQWLSRSTYQFSQPSNKKKLSNTVHLADTFLIWFFLFKFVHKLPSLSKKKDSTSTSCKQFFLKNDLFQQPFWVLS